MESLEEITNFKELNIVSEVKNEIRGNFKKSKFNFNESGVEVGVSIYSNLIFIIITGNSKIGALYIGQTDKEDPLDSEENFHEVSCLLGNRKDEVTQHFATFLITQLLNYLSKKNSKIQKILLSSSIKFNELMKTGLNDDDILQSKEYKNFLEVTKSEIGNIL
jgi:hypothetical protein